MKPIIKTQSIGSWPLAIALLCLLAVSASAQVLTLDSVLRAVDARNPMLQEYTFKVKALNTYTNGAKSWMAPMVGAGTFMTPYPGQMIMDEGDKGSFMITVTGYS